MEALTDIQTSALIIKSPINPAYQEILSNEALCFVEKLERHFRDTRQILLDNRIEMQKKIDSGILPDFLPETEHIRSGNWQINRIPNDLLDRRVEITGPVSRKMIINALNSGVKVFMADFEDSNSPTWDNIIDGQINLRDAVNKTITFTNPHNDKFYQLNDSIATLMVRPRGWHLYEKNIELDGMPLSASIVDFGLFFYHNAKNQIANGSGPYFYLPKLEHHKEAELWNDIFIMAQEELNIPIGTIKATVLIETILAAFQMDEIIYELKEHSAGLNCGRWDYIFSYIKRLALNPNYILPDRSQVIMGDAFLNSYSLLLIKTCHKRGAFAMGGMAAQIPVKNNDEENDKAFEKVRNDKEREVNNGHDGTWVAHPGLVPVAMEIFDNQLSGDNQLDVSLDNVTITQDDLLEVHKGQRTEEGMRECIKVGVQYIEAWLAGRGAVPLYNLMEDAATAEISRAQIWQWLKHATKLDDGRTVNEELFKDILTSEIANLKEVLGEEVWAKGKYEKAVEIFEKMSISPVCEEFLTLPAYEEIVSS